jgi:hypothetical protein
MMFQVIPRQLCDNAGFDATDVLNKLRQKHALQSGWHRSAVFIFLFFIFYFILLNKGWLLELPFFSSYMVTRIS